MLERVVNYRVMEISDYDQVISLWQEVEGVCLREADSESGIEKYLLRNPDLSFVAEDNGKIVGTIMSGHDGRRGYIQHLAVGLDSRRKGVASKLLDLCLNALRREGIIKSHIHVLTTNTSAKQFWQKSDWFKRDDIDVYSFTNGGSENT